MTLTVKSILLNLIPTKTSVRVPLYQAWLLYKMDWNRPIWSKLYSYRYQNIPNCNIAPMCNLNCTNLHQTIHQNLKIKKCAMISHYMLLCCFFKVDRFQYVVDRLLIYTICIMYYYNVKVLYVTRLCKLSSPEVKLLDGGKHSSTIV